jgi:hypothetical protein
MTPTVGAFLLWSFDGCGIILLRWGLALPRDAPAGPDLARVPAKWNPVRRQEHAPKIESAAFSIHMASLGDLIWMETL